MKKPTLKEMTSFDKDTYSRISFKNDALQGEYILVGGAVTTPSLFENFAMNPAHLGDDGKVRRYRQVIADFDDIEYLGEMEL